MSTFLQVIAGALVSVVIGLALSKQGKDITLLLGITVCTMVLAAALVYLKPVMDFAQSLQQLSMLDSSMLRIMLKAVGISLIAEIACLICTDSGNGALSKGIQIFASVTVLCISVPLMKELLELIQKILGEI
jgi:stage III sporulation protein AD